MYTFDLSIIIYVLLIDFLAVMSPGPDFFMVLKNTLANSVRAGFDTACGITLGSTITFSCGLLGIGAIVASSHIVFILIKILGALYLSYLAFKAIFLKNVIQEPQLSHLKKEHYKGWRYFKMGLICNVTNPKAFMFIVSLSTYVAEHTNRYFNGLIIVIMSSLFTLIWFTFVALVFGRIRIRKFYYEKQRLINIIFGLILLYIAFKIIVFN